MQILTSLIGTASDQAELKPRHLRLTTDLRHLCHPSQSCVRDQTLTDAAQLTPRYTVRNRTIQPDSITTIRNRAVPDIAQQTPADAPSFLP